MVAFCRYDQEQPMERQSNHLIYDSIGVGYRRFRIPDSRIAGQIRKAIGNASTVCNIGAGTGSYEPSDLNVTPVEPSERMIAQRVDPERAVRANAENLPFKEAQFDVAMAVLTVHHWTDPRKGLREMKRVSRRQVVMTFDPFMVDSFWLVRDYLPEFAAFDKDRAPALEVYEEILGACRISPVLVPWDCSDGFLAAYWRRPERYLDLDARNAISSFQQIPEAIVSAAILRLKNDVESGAWAERYSDLWERDAMDFGYRLVVSGDAAEHIKV
jgi:SAM-dependent methyltransferase